MGLVDDLSILMNMFFELILLKSKIDEEFSVQMCIIDVWTKKMLVKI